MNRQELIDDIRSITAEWERGDTSGENAITRISLTLADYDPFASPAQEELPGDDFHQSGDSRNGR